MKLKHLKKTAPCLPDLLLYDCMPADGVHLLSDGCFMACWQYSGPDMASKSHAEMDALSGRLHRVLMLGSGWMVHCSAIRSSAEGYPSGGAFPDPITRMIDEERRAEFLREDQHFESDYFLTLTYHPPSVIAERIKGWLFSGVKKRERHSALLALGYFEDKVESVEAQLRSLLTIRRLKFDPDTGFDDSLRYIHRCISGDDHPIMLPEVAEYLNDIVAGAGFLPGLEPRVGGKHVRVVAIDGFPLTSTPGILHELDTIGAEYRWTTRAILLDQEDARVRIEREAKTWSHKRKKKASDHATNTETGPIDMDADQMVGDALGTKAHDGQPATPGALGENASGAVQFCVYDSNVIVIDGNLARLDNTVATIVKTIRNLGFTCRVEDINAVEAYLGSLPGDGYRNVRRTLVHTLNLADMLPVTSVWAGPAECPSKLMPPHSPVLLYGTTTGATPFRFTPFVDDVGHSMFVGPSGSGKSSLLALMAAQQFRYPGAQVFAFDKGYSMYALTKAAGGEFYNPGREADFALQPLANLEDSSDISWANEWLEVLCVLQGAEVGPRERGLLADAVNVLRFSPHRTMVELWANVQDVGLKQALAPYLPHNALGDLLGGDHDSIRESRFVTFELEALLDMGERAVGAVLPCLFRHIERRVQRGRGEPRMILVDEAWAALRHPIFVDRLRSWLKEMRKKNAAVILATQTLSDVFGSPVEQVVLTECKTKLLMPNAVALEPASVAHYRAIGLWDREIEQIRDGMPKGDCYCASEAGRRMWHMHLGPVALAFCGANSAEERAQIESLAAEYGAAWPEEWLQRRGVIKRREVAAYAN